MKNLLCQLACATVTMLFLAGSAHAIGIEAAVGVWDQDPGGYVSYKEVVTTDRLNLENDLGYSKKVRINGRLKIETPLALPNIYLMATPMSFEGTGSKSVLFKFGDYIFSSGVPFTSKLTLDHYDATFYYGLPFLKTATMGVLNVDLGILARLVDFKAEVSQSLVTQSIHRLLPIPMLYGGVQVKPFNWLAVEGEARGVAYAHNYYYDLIARGKLKPIGPVFIAGGYRYEKVKIDQNDIRANANFGGPFGEVGFEF